MCVQRCGPSACKAHHLREPWRVVAHLRTAPKHRLLAGAQNNHASCSDWAAAGECENNPGYMLTNCKDACDLQTMEVAASFYELSAETASGATLDFETLRDKVVLITNVASE